MSCRLSAFIVISLSPRTEGGQVPIEVSSHDDTTHWTTSVSIVRPSQVLRSPMPRESIEAFVDSVSHNSSVPFPIRREIVASFIHVSRLKGKKSELGSWHVLKHVLCSRWRSMYSPELFAQLPLPSWKSPVSLRTDPRTESIPLLTAIFKGSVRASKSVRDSLVL